MIEAEAVRRASELGADWSALEPAVRQIAALDATSAWADAVEADLAFHRALVAVVGSAHLTRAHELLMSEMRLALAGNAGREVPGFMAGEHRAMLETFQRGEAAASVAALRNHLGAGLDVVDVRGGANPRPRPAL
jgi:DNA-binding GntR family transcriptional regulator